MKQVTGRYVEGLVTVLRDLREYYLVTVLPEGNLSRYMYQIWYRWKLLILTSTYIITILSRYCVCTSLFASAL